MSVLNRDSAACLEDQTVAPLELVVESHVAPTHVFVLSHVSTIF